MGRNVGGERYVSEEGKDGEGIVWSLKDNILSYCHNIAYSHIVILSYCNIVIL